MSFNPNREWHEVQIAEHERVISRTFKERHQMGLSAARHVVTYLAAGLRGLREQIDEAPTTTNEYTHELFHDGIAFKHKEYPFEVNLTDDSDTVGWGAFVHRAEAQAAAVAKGERDGCEVYGYRAGEHFGTHALDECIIFYIVVDEA